MQPRIEYGTYGQEALKSMAGLEKYIAQCGLDHKLIHLIKMRASQINGCAYCIDMHSIDARTLGKANSGSMRSMPGAKLRFSTNANGRLSNGPNL